MGRRQVGRQGRGQVDRHEGAGADPALDMALGQQLLVHRDHRAARHPKPLCQQARRRQAAAGRRGTVQDQPPQPVMDLPEQRRRQRLPVDGEGQQGGPVGHGAAYQDWSVHIEAQIGPFANHFPQVVAVAIAQETRMSDTFEKIQAQPRRPPPASRQVRQGHGVRHPGFGPGLPHRLRHRRPALLHADVVLARGRPPVLAWLLRQPDDPQPGAAACRCA